MSLRRVRYSVQCAICVHAHTSQMATRCIMYMQCKGSIHIPDTHFAHSSTVTIIAVIYTHGPFAPTALTLAQRFEHISFLFTVNVLISEQIEWIDSFIMIVISCTVYNVHSIYCIFAKLTEIVVFFSSIVCDLLLLVCL